MGLFNFLEPETIYFFVRVRRYFGSIPKDAMVSLNQNHEPSILDCYYNEEIQKYVIVERHQYLSYKKSVELWRSTIERDITEEFRGNVFYSVRETDQQQYANYCEEMVQGNCMMETRLR